MSVDDAHPAAGTPVDLAKCALLRCWTGGEGRDLRVHEIRPDADGQIPPERDPESGQWQVGLEWEEPRDVRRVVVRFAAAVPADVRVQYWRRNWPTPAPERLPGARRGWIGRDDPYHGTWTTARGVVTVEGDTFSIAFDPIDLPEIGGREAADQLATAEDYRAPFRRTLKLRVVGTGEPPRIAGIHAYSRSTWREGEVEVRFGLRQPATCDWSGHADAYNGHILGIEPLDAPGAEAAANSSWRLQTSGQPKGLRLRILYADCDPNAGDRTIVTMRTQARSFSFLVTDLDRGPIYIPDYHVLVNWAGQAPDPAALEAQVAAAPRPIYDRVLQEPEQSLERAIAEIPPLDETITAPHGRYMPLGVEAGRQEWALRYNGELFGDKRILKLLGRDAAGLQWPAEMLRFRFGSGDPPDFRERRGATRQWPMDGWLPVYASLWLDREIEYRQTAFAALLDGPMTPASVRRGDENIVVMMQLAIRNTTHGRKRARLWIVDAPQEALALQDGLVLAEGRVVPAEPVKRQWRVDAYPAPCLRYAATAGKGTLTAVPFWEEPEASQATPAAVAYDVELEGGESDILTLAFPFVSLTCKEDWQRVAALDYEAKLADVSGYWRGYVGSGGQLDLPDDVLSDFHKAVRAHVAISVDKDPVSGLTVVPAATWAYGACGNEGCWQISMLDQAGHHDRAEDYLETFLRTQGARGLDGDFSSAEGVLQALDLDGGEILQGHFAYNLDPGYIMECLANHYRYSGDREWLSRVTSNLIAACDMVSRERESTRRNGPDGRPAPEWGLLPAGHLEDNPEWRHWFAVNAHAYAGMKAIADVVAEVRHLEAERLAEEAAAYREDIRRAARRAMVEAPVVRLLDGTYIPHLPTRTGIRGREWGWFREAAYGALHLLEGNVFEPDEEEMTWVLKDLEDNLFVSREWGRPVDLEHCWFSQGGVTIQANLMDLGIDYLRRGQIKHAIRALFNNLGQQLYPEQRVFTEHPVVELGHGVGPFYKTPDESKSLIWLRSCLLWEEGDVLHVAPAAPRAYFEAGQSWGLERMATFFGPVSYRVEAGGSEVSVRVDVPNRRPPQELVVHVRRAGMKAVTVNGKAHAVFDPAAETVTVSRPAGRLQIRVEL